MVNVWIKLFLEVALQLLFEKITWDYLRKITSDGMFCYYWQEKEKSFQNTTVKSYTKQKVKSLQYH